MGDLGPRAVIGALGIDVRLGGQRDDTAPVIGCSPTLWAWIERDIVTGSVFVAIADESPVSWAYALHEAIHLVLGTATLDEEWGMMAVEWSVAHELAEPWFAAWRDSFSNYGMPWEVRGPDTGHRHANDIGDDDTFLLSEAWADVVVDAVRRQWLVDHCGRDVPVWGMGVHRSIARGGEYG